MSSYKENILDKILKNNEINTFNFLILKNLFNKKFFNIKIQYNFYWITIVKTKDIEKYSELLDLNFNILRMWYSYHNKLAYYYKIDNIDWKYTIFVSLKDSISVFEFNKISMYLKYIFLNKKCKKIKKDLIKIFEYEKWYINEFQKFYRSIDTLQYLFEKNSIIHRLIWNNIMKNKKESIYYLTLIIYLLYWDNFQIREFKAIEIQFNNVIKNLQYFSHWINLFKISNKISDIDEKTITKYKKMNKEKIKTFKDEFQIMKFYIDEIFWKNWYHIHSNILSKYYEVYDNIVKIESFFEIIN